jgi:hypothetical protein
MSPRTYSAEEREEYRCLTRIEQGPGACPQTPIERATIDAAALAYFEEVGLDADALRSDIAAAVDDRRALVRDQLRDAVAEERKAAERLERVRRDYQDEKIDADDWREQREQLSEELEAARAALKQAETRETALVEAEKDAANPESDAQRRLEAIRDAVSGKVKENADDIEALRTALAEMFEAFYVLPADHHEAVLAALPTDEAEAAAAVRQRLEQRQAFDFNIDGYRIFPQPRADALAGLGGAFEPLLKRRSLPATTDDDGLTT